MKLKCAEAMKMNQRGFGENSCQKIKVDYAKQERTLAFSHSMEESEQHIGDLHEMLSKCPWGPGSWAP